MYFKTSEFITECFKLYKNWKLNTLNWKDELRLSDLSLKIGW